mmetsp:Transcript_83114/g.158666  ORF Transcript_83114/g.158666 Transcript_83114/m.158666 type:complete len:274 (+) Transcript_83114:157-978(+)
MLRSQQQLILCWTFRSWSQRRDSCRSAHERQLQEVLNSQKATVHDLQVAMGDALASKCHERAQLARFFIFWSCQSLLTESQATAEVMLHIHKVSGRKLQLINAFSLWRSKSSSRCLRRASSIYLHNRHVRVTMILVLISWLQFSRAVQWVLQAGSEVMSDIFLAKEATLIEWAVRQVQIRLVAKIFFAWHRVCNATYLYSHDMAMGTCEKLVKLTGRVAHHNLEQRLSHQVFIHWVNLRLHLKAGRVVVDTTEQLRLWKIMLTWWTICLQSRQ